MNITSLQHFADNPTVNVTTDSKLSAENKTFYDRALVEEAGPNLIHGQFGQKRPIPKNGGKRIQFRRYASLPKALKPLTEGVTPEGRKLSATAVEAEVNQYGDFVCLSDVLDLTAIAQSSPGSIAINASILVGYHVAGIPGALITVVGAALPPLIIISIISAFYQAFRSNRYVSMAMAGMLAGVAAVIFDVVINMAWPILKKKRWLPIVVMLASFVATRFFSVNIIVIILVCGVIGALDTLYLQKKEGAK